MVIYAINLKVLKVFSLLINRIFLKNLFTNSVKIIRLDPILD